MSVLVQNGARMRLRPVGLLGWTLSMAVVPALAGTESVPASIRACVAETDADRRLACFDRELARYAEPAPKAEAKREVAAPAHASTTAPATAAADAGSPAVSASPGTADGQKASTQNNTPKASQHISARIVAIDSSPGEMVLHLDNGQVWQQVQGVSGDLSLRTGDTVTIDKHLGSYWLSGPHVTGMKVRQKS